MGPKEQFIAYEYKNTTVPRDFENIYPDSLPNFGHKDCCSVVYR
jgi:hypothetical protein